VPGLQSILWNPRHHRKTLAAYELFPVSLRTGGQGVPRTWCRTDGVHQVPVPWAREGSGFTLMMEALVMLLSAEMPVDAMADLLDEHDTRLWRVLMHYVEQAHAKSDWSAVRRIAVDETSARRGRRYVTNVLDAENSRLLLMVEGRGVQALGAFAEALRRHGGDPSQIEAIAMDMSTSYMKGARQYFPQATIVFDKFHVIVMAAKPSRRCGSNSSAREPSSKG
jgi:transposase